MKNEKLEKAMFGAGCFWGVEETFSHIKGVKSTAVGYSGGITQNPTYEDVCGGKTGHAEVVQIEFDPSKVSYKELFEVFWASHDPTTSNRQGPDIGEQYRSAIFFHSSEQESIANHSKESQPKSGRFKSKIVTEIAPARTFYKAEDYHQQYLRKKGLGSCPT